MFYDSSEEMDKDAPDNDPWLPAWTPEGSPDGDWNSVSLPCRLVWGLLGTCLLRVSVEGGKWEGD